MSNFGSGVVFVAKRALDRYIFEPHRKKSWRSKVRPFEHTTPDGNKFMLQPRAYIDSCIFLNGAFEHRFLQLVSKRLPIDSVVLDVGANIGNHAIYWARYFKKIYAFEPNPRTVELLKHNLELNGLSGVVGVHDVGLGSTSAIAKFAENNDGDLGSSHFLQQGETVGPKDIERELRIEQADSYISNLNINRIDLIKADVEGWEPQLFEGLRETIAEFRPIVAFEFHGQFSKIGEYERILANLPGYTVVEPVYAPPLSSTWQKLKWNLLNNGAPTFERLISPELRTYENLLAFPDEASLERFFRH